MRLVAAKLLSLMQRKVANKRPPDLIIGEKTNPYLLRWWVIPRNPVFNIYLHYIRRSDDDRALHDHPWLFNISFLLRGGYVEHTIKAGGINVRVHRTMGAIKVRGASFHRLEIVGGQPCWTLFITGPVVRYWGFACPKGWVNSKDFQKTEGGVSTATRGCGEYA